jgi:hypothetical protein
MVNQFFFYVIVYLIYTLNLQVLTELIRNGLFENKFWTRSLRSIFIMPPLAIILMVIILLKDSLKMNFINISKVMEKRKGSDF